MLVFRPRSPTPAQPRIYHIIHVDRLDAILKDGFIYSDSNVTGTRKPGTMIGFAHTKHRRAEKPLGAGLKVGECVPFYYCPRSVMLYVISQRNHPQLAYRGGQDPIIHLEFDPLKVADWAESVGLRYYVTDVSAATDYFTAYGNIDALNCLDWDAIGATHWTDVTDRKQAEFLVEGRVPISLVGRIGVKNRPVATMVGQLLKLRGLLESVEIAVVPQWYY